MLSVRGLSKSFGAKRVLDGVDLDLPEGESLVVIGGSGTGKSVLLRCILGLETPDGGDILWRDAPLAGQLPVANSWNRTALSRTTSRIRTTKRQ